MITRLHSGSHWLASSEADRYADEYECLEVSINGKRIGVYVPPEGSTFAAMVGNIPRKYMRAHIMTENDVERWQWQLPNIKLGQRISFRLVRAPVGSGVPPQFVR